MRDDTLHLEVHLLSLRTTLDPCLQHGAQFKGDKIKAWCKELKIMQNFTVVAHSQANGQVEVLVESW